jgi:hypothetical protein
LELRRGRITVAAPVCAIRGPQPQGRVDWSRLKADAPSEFDCCVTGRSVTGGNWNAAQERRDRGFEPIL